MKFVERLVPSRCVTSASFRLCSCRRAQTRVHSCLRLASPSLSLPLTPVHFPCFFFLFRFVFCGKPCPNDDNASIVHDFTPWMCLHSSTVVGLAYLRFSLTTQSCGGENRQQLETCGINWRKKENKKEEKTASLGRIGAVISARSGPVADARLVPYREPEWSDLSVETAMKKKLNGRSDEYEFENGPVTNVN